MKENICILAEKEVSSVDLGKREFLSGTSTLLKCVNLSTGKEEERKKERNKNKIKEGAKSFG